MENAMSMEQETYRSGTGTDVPRVPRVPWANITRVTAVMIVLTVFIGLFYKQTFVLLSDRNTLDIAQIARNVSQGEGYSTRFIRPFNTGLPSMSETRFPFPELNHAPVFPWLVGQIFRLRGPSDQAVIWISLAFLILTIIATGILGRLLFDWDVALLAASMVGLSAYVLNISISGGEWTMIAFLFTLMLCAVALHYGTIKSSRVWAGLVWAAICAVLLGMLYATNYVMILLIIPLGIYFGITGRAKWIHLGVFLSLCTLLVIPLAKRNYDLTGSPVLGVSAWDIMANTRLYPGDTFYRSINPEANSFIRTLLFPIEHFPSFAEKLVRGSFDRASSLIPMLGLLGLPFAIVSMLYKFKPQQANAVRGLVYGVIPIVIVCLALYSVDTKAVVMLAPVIAIFSSAYLLLLLNAKKIHIIYFRALVGAFVIITALPGITTIAWGTGQVEYEKTNAANRFFVGKEGGVVYTDVPWLAAWRANRLAVWLPKRDEDVMDLSSHGLPLQLIVLTPESDNYLPNEIWYALHRVRWWRDYVYNPNLALKTFAKYLDSVRLPYNINVVKDNLKRLHRDYPMSDLLVDFVTYPSYPLAPDDIQILSVQ